ncbi:unnamed protein product [Protopolystoma xenopodis]|uniref:Uncharacterized protein n=1 Tax=Protopolystoma xenopodis TaxID=117903 RepID=A0A3S5CBL0_9PLAT|nr:unnamed protein product [Protopolystoma xenopodis]
MELDEAFLNIVTGSSGSIHSSSDLSFYGGDDHETDLEDPFCSLKINCPLMQLGTGSYGSPSHSLDPESWSPKHLHLKSYGCHHLPSQEMAYCQTDPNRLVPNSRIQLDNPSYCPQSETGTWLDGQCVNNKGKARPYYPAMSMSHPLPAPSQLINRSQIMDRNDDFADMA